MERQNPGQNDQTTENVAALCPKHHPLWPGGAFGQKNIFSTAYDTNLHFNPQVPDAAPQVSTKSVSLRFCLSKSGLSPFDIFLAKSTHSQRDGKKKIKFHFCIFRRNDGKCRPPCRAQNKKRSAAAKRFAFILPRSPHPHTSGTPPRPAGAAPGQCAGATAPVLPPQRRRARPETAGCPPPSRQR